MYIIKKAVFIIMKKLLALVLSIVCICALLCSCGGKDVDLNSISKSINENYSLSGLTVVEDTSKLNRYYQIDENIIDINVIILIILLLVFE